MECRAVEISRKWDVAHMGFRAVEMSRTWDNAKKSAQMMWTPKKVPISFMVSMWALQEALLAAGLTKTTKKIISNSVGSKNNDSNNNNTHDDNRAVLKLVCIFHHTTV